MFHSFVVGVTPEGRRHPLFVGTIGEARSFADTLEKARGLHDGTQYQAMHVVEGVSATHVSPFPVPAAAPTAGTRLPSQPQASAAATDAAASTSSEEASAGVESGTTVYPPSVAAGSGELSQAAKPGLDDVLAPAPTTKVETREQYVARLADTPRPDLMKEMLRFPSLRLKSGISNADLRKFLVEAKFSAP